AAELREHDADDPHRGGQRAARLLGRRGAGEGRRGARGAEPDDPVLPGRSHAARADRPRAVHELSALAPWLRAPPLRLPGADRRRARARRRAWWGAAEEE